MVDTGGAAVISRAILQAAILQLESTRGGDRQGDSRGWQPEGVLRVQGVQGTENGQQVDVLSALAGGGRDRRRRRQVGLCSMGKRQPSRLSGSSIANWPAL